MLLLADLVPFMQPMPLGWRLAIGMLTGTILVARSPSSAMAIVTELRAKGPFTRTVLGVTVLMDVVVVVSFAVTTSVVDVIVNAEGFDLVFVVILAIELGLSVLLGILVGRLLGAILKIQSHQYFKVVVLLLTGLAIYSLSGVVREFTQQWLPAELLLEPLLIALIAGFYVNNFTAYRAEFVEIIRKVRAICVSGLFHAGGR